MLNREDWHRRFIQQAAWTEPLRRFVFSRIRLPEQSHILEAGCGTGAVLAAVKSLLLPSCLRFGIDINFDFLELAHQKEGSMALNAADVYALPFKTGEFEACFCHFLLLWLKEPAAALAEMARVTCQGGWVIALAEPDYGGRIDYPHSLEKLGSAQAAALLRQGANPNTGRSLRRHFQSAGLKNISAGLLGAEWPTPPGLPPGWDMEWEILTADLEGSLSKIELEVARESDRQAWLNGERVLYVPTFYAVGQVG